MIQKKTAKALYYSGKEYDPWNRKHHWETQIPGSKLAWVIHCIISLNHCGPVTTEKLPAVYPKPCLCNMPAPCKDALAVQLVPITSLHCQPFLCPRSICRGSQGRMFSTLQIHTLLSFAENCLCGKAFILPVPAAPFCKIKSLQGPVVRFNSFFCNTLRLQVRSAVASNAVYISNYTKERERPNCNMDVDVILHT